MKIKDVNIPAKTVDERDRNFRIVMYCELERQGDVKIDAHRQLILVDPATGKEVVSSELTPKNHVTERNLSAVASEQFDVGGGKMVSVAEAALVLEKATDKASTEDDWYDE